MAWAPVGNLKGPKGDDGDQGEQGPAGTVFETDTAPTPAYAGQPWWNVETGRTFISIADEDDVLVWVEWRNFGARGPQGPGVIVVDYANATDAYIQTLPEERRVDKSVVVRRPT